MRKNIFIALMSSLLFMFSCGKEDYYQDTGVNDPRFDGDIMDYLDSKPFHFDTLSSVIRLAGLDDFMRKETLTFFALPDPAIGKAIDALNKELTVTGQDSVLSLDQVAPQVWEEFISEYIIKGSYGLNDFPQVDTAALNAFPGQVFQSVNNRPFNVGVNYHDAVSGDTRIKYAGYRQIMISYIPDFSQPRKDWVNTFVSSSNITPDNGRVHVLNYNTHIIGHDVRRFVSRVLEVGLIK